MDASRVIEIAREEGVAPSEALAIFALESSSGTDPSVNTPNEKGAVGPFQLLPTTFASVMPKGSDINNPEDNVRAGIRYLKQSLDASGGNREYAGYLYHGGPNTKNWGDKTIAYGQKFEKLSGEMEDHQASFSLPSSAAFSAQQNVSPRDTGIHPIRGSVQNSPETVVEKTSVEKFSFLEKDTMKELLSDISKSTEAVVAASQKQTASLSELQGQYQEETASYLEAIGIADQKKAGVDLAQAAMLAKHGSESATRLTQAGINSSDIDNLGAKLLLKMRDQVEQIDILHDSLNERANALPSFPDNPLGYVVGHMMLKGDIAKHNNLQTQLNQNKQNLATLTSMQDNLEQSNLPKLDTLNALKSRALADSVLADASVKQAEIRRQSIAVNQGFVTHELENQKLVLAAKESALRLYQTIDTAEARQAEKQTKIDIEESRLKSVNTIALQVGRKPFVSMSEFEKQPMQVKAAYTQVINSDGNVLGSTPIQALKNIRAIGNPNAMSGDIRTLYSFAASFELEAQKELSIKEDYKNKKPEEQAMERNTSIQKKFDAMQDDTQKNPLSDRANLYHAPSVSIMLKNPEVFKTPLGKILADSLKIAPTNPLSDSKIIEIVKEQLASKEGYPGGLEQAAKDISTYYEEAIKINNATYNFNAWALPAQDRYKIKGTDVSKYEKVIKDLAKIYPFSAPMNLLDALKGAYNISPAPL